MLTRRSLLNGGAAGIASVALAACATTTTTNPTTGVTTTTYGLDPAAIAFIQNAVGFVKQYVPTIESIAATAISLFGPQYASLVALGTTAINTVISTLESLIPGAPPASMRASRFTLVNRSLGRKFVGWTVTHVPVYAQ